MASEANRMFIIEASEKTYENWGAARGSFEKIFKHLQKPK